MGAELTIAIAQTNPTVGAITNNLALIRATRARAAEAGADLVVFSELVVVGYPPEDLVLKPALQEHVACAVQALAEDTASGPAMIVGAPWRDRGNLYNAMLLLHGGRIVTARYKHDLPNYGVFDEKRVFAPGPIPGPMALPLAGGDEQIRIGGMVCEDMWTEDVAEGLQESGAEILIVPNGSPFEADKQDVRMNLAVARITETGLPLIYCNQVGGQDELVFDGASFVLNADRRLAAQAKAFEEDLLITRWRRDGDVWTCIEGRITPPVEGLEAVYRAMCLGLRDYVDKNGFPGVVLGLSGGIDSALSAVVAVDALGAQRVHGVMMPSRYTSQASLEDARAVAGALGIRLDQVSIEPGVAAFEAMLAPIFRGLPPDITEENIQARIRGVLLMAISNKQGAMLLTTGNKSEMSVGYATLYGDMCGGYSVLKDVYKTAVFALSRWRNQHRPAGALGPAGAVIPERVITRPPSAELRADQTDQDSLPPYDVLDAILQGLVETDLSARDLVEQGYDPEVVRKVSNLLDVAEYKRRQAPPGVKITRKAFGRDRRYPITNAFRRMGFD
ncbi:MAG TPA: NAD+ synthase [Geminicoccaceae bacterium]|nr:NAD+ synthase [Geminicoccaceae bacterium]